MKIRVFPLYCRIFCCLYFFLSIALELLAVQDMLTQYLPKSGEAGAWIREGEPQHFDGEALYEYIDGGAEIYHEYGFKRVAVQDYINPAGKSVSVEVFEMTNSESAYGIYTFKTHKEGRKVALGDDAQLADYYLNFWKGNILVTLTGFDETPETRDGLLLLAQEMDAKLDLSGKRPQIVPQLPGKNFILQSVKYFKGILGLRNSHPFFSLDIWGFEEGVKADYAQGYSVFIFRFKDSDQSYGQYERLKKSGAEHAEYKVHKTGDREILTALDNRERRFFVSIHRTYIFLLLGDVDHIQALEIFQEIQEEIGD
jgi:hypothetical protein